MLSPNIDDEHRRLDKLVGATWPTIVRDRMVAARRGALTKLTGSPAEIILEPVPRLQAKTQADRYGSANTHRRSREPLAPNGSWPRLMRAATAAAYMDEVSVDAFRRRVRSGVYAEAARFPGRGELWLRDDLDKSIDQLSARVDRIRDAADVL